MPLQEGAGDADGIDPQRAVAEGRLGRLREVIRVDAEIDMYHEDTYCPSTYMARSMVLATPSRSDLLFTAAANCRVPENSATKDTVPAEQVMVPFASANTLLFRMVPDPFSTIAHTPISAKLQLYRIA